MQHEEAGKDRKQEGRNPAEAEGRWQENAFRKQTVKPGKDDEKCDTPRPQLIPNTEGLRVSWPIRLFFSNVWTVAWDMAVHDDFPCRLAEDSAHLGWTLDRVRLPSNMVLLIK